MPLVRTTDLGKEYGQADQTVVALRAACLEVEAGALVAITGTSGSGKSTLLSLIGAIDRPTSGAVWLLGEPLGEASSARLARIRHEHVGFVFQDFRLVRHLSALDNVRLPLLFGAGDDGAERPRELLERFGIGHRLHHRPSELSRGEMQRVALARALINRPELLLADEPTANLDRGNTELLWELLIELNESNGTTVIVATHSADQVPKVRREIRLENGSIVRDETR